MKLTLKNSMMLLLAVCYISLSPAALAQGKKGKDKEETKDVVIEKKIHQNEEGDDHHGQGDGMGIKGLTDDQKQKIEKMKTANKKEMMQLKNLIDEKKAHLKTLETADNADLNAINKTIDEMGDLKKDLMKKKASHKQEIRKILNDEQRLQFDLKHNGEGKKGMKNKQMKKMRKGGHGMDTDKDIEIKIIQEDDND